MVTRVNVAVEHLSDERVKAGMERVVRFMRRRWKHRVPGGRFPGAFVKQMKRHPFLQELARTEARTGAIRLPDLNHFAETIERRDGSVLDRMFIELGGDPADYICVDCHDEIPLGHARCEPCAQWRKTGVTS